MFYSASARSSARCALVASRSAALRREAALKKLPKAKKEALCAGWEEKNLPRLSVASRADAKDILELYNWYVLHHTATFQVTPSTLEEYEDWVDNTLKVAPLLLARDADGRLLAPLALWRQGVLSDIILFVKVDPIDFDWIDALGYLFSGCGAVG